MTQLSLNLKFENFIHNLLKGSDYDEHIGKSFNIKSDKFHIDFVSEVLFESLFKYWLFKL